LGIQAMIRSTFDQYTTLNCAFRWALPSAKLLLVNWTHVIVSVLLSMKCISLSMQAESKACKLVNIF
jgi:hypothetical protein